MRLSVALLSVQLFGSVKSFGSTIQQDVLNPAFPESSSCDCTGTTPSGAGTGYYICDDPRLGPPVLPWRLPLLSLVSNYDRFGGLTPGAFLAKWWDPNSSWGPSWRYPDHGGFVCDAYDQPLNATFTLRAGMRVDRFGSTTGRYMGAADAPFAQRSLPPDALDVCPPKKGTTEPCRPKDHPWGYWLFEVVRDFNVSAGAIAPAFEQPGLGVQFYISDGRRVQDLVTAGLLKTLNISRVSNGPQVAHQCGVNPVKCDCLPPAMMM